MDALKVTRDKVYFTKLFKNEFCPGQVVGGGGAGGQVAQMVHAQKSLWMVWKKKFLRYICFSLFYPRTWLIVVENQSFKSWSRLLYS